MPKKQKQKELVILEEFLKKNKMSCYRLAKLIIVGQNTISRWKSEKRKVPKWLPVMLHLHEYYFKQNAKWMD